MKRFYSRVDVMEGDDGHFSIELDNRPIRTPEGAFLSVPTRPLAERLSVEWAAQRDEIDPASMPFTGLSNAVIDRISSFRDQVVEALARAIHSDPVRFRADGPDDLVASELSTWDPLLSSFRERFGVALDTTVGFNAVTQSPEAETCVRNYADARDDFRLTAFSDAAGHLGSVLIAIALLEDNLTPESAFEAAYLEELHQAGRWGIDKEAEGRRRAIRRDIAIAHEFDRLCIRPDPKIMLHRNT